MKIASSAVIEYRCDCGSAIGYIERGPGYYVAVVGERIGGLNGRRETKLKLPGDMQDLRNLGMIVRCGNDHGRLIVGDDWSIPRGRERRKVIVSRHAEDAPDR